jgi:hypothetical protein
MNLLVIVPLILSLAGADFTYLPSYAAPKTEQIVSDIVSDYSIEQVPVSSIGHPYFVGDKVIICDANPKIYMFDTKTQKFLKAISPPKYYCIKFYDKYFVVVGEDDMAAGIVAYDYDFNVLKGTPIDTLPGTDTPVLAKFVNNPEYDPGAMHENLYATFAFTDEDHIVYNPRLGEHTQFWITDLTKKGKRKESRIDEKINDDLSIWFTGDIEEYAPGYVAIYGTLFNPKDRKGNDYGPEGDWYDNRFGKIIVDSKGKTVGYVYKKDNKFVSVK